jgi:excisionase family DNA binding protein
MGSDRYLLDVNEAAELCHLKVCTIRRWVSKKRFPYVRMGRRVLFLRQDIEAFIEINSVKVLPEPKPDDVHLPSKAELLAALSVTES